MDIVSHGLYGSVAFGRKNKRAFWLAFLFGIAPDLFSFGIFTLGTMFGLEERPSWQSGPPPMSSIPAYVDALYNYTHSLMIFGVVFLLVWFIRKKILWPMFAWPLHIIFDIFTHSTQFFPTPFLWPISNFKVNGISWGTPHIFWSYITLLVLIYIIWGIKVYLAKREKKDSMPKGGIHD